jgi:hypothetical protein
MDGPGVDEQDASFESAHGAALQTGAACEVDIERRTRLRLEREAQRTTPLFESRSDPFDLAGRHVAWVGLLQEQWDEILALDRRGTAPRRK